MVKPFYLIRKIYPDAIWNLSHKDKCVYLTFDDGPIPEVTPWVLNQLKAYNAKATFFCVGENVEKHSIVYNQIINEGHSIGNHTHKHVNGWKSNNKKYFDEIGKCATLVKSDLFRPPYGKMRFSQYQGIKHKYKIIMWDVLSYDFDAKTSPEKCLKNVVENAKSGSIVVFHDSLKAKNNLFSALPKVLDHFTNKGYRFLGI